MYRILNAQYLIIHFYSDILVLFNSHRHTKEIQRSIRYLILATNGTTVIAVIFGSLNLIAVCNLIFKTLKLILRIN